MRISDWSSDVCSSDLLLRQARPARQSVCGPRQHRTDDQVQLLKTCAETLARTIVGARHSVGWAKRSVRTCSGMWTTSTTTPSGTASSVERPTGRIRVFIGSCAAVTCRSTGRVIPQPGDHCLAASRTDRVDTLRFAHPTLAAIANAKGAIRRPLRPPRLRLKVSRSGEDTYEILSLI